RKSKKILSENRLHNKKSSFIEDNNNENNNDKNVINMSMSNIINTISKSNSNDEISNWYGEYGVEPYDKSEHITVASSLNTSLLNTPTINSINTSYIEDHKNSAIEELEESTDDITNL